MKETKAADLKSLSNHTLITGGLTTQLVPD